MELNIRVGEVYPASQIIDEISKYQSNQAPVKMGHIVIESPKTKSGNKTKEDIHMYHLDIEKLKSLKNTPVRVLSIINPCEQNFAANLINLKETQENLKKIEENKTLCYLFDGNDLINAGYKLKGMKSAIKCLNCVFVKKLMPFEASPYSEGITEKKHFIRVTYKH